MANTLASNIIQAISRSSGVGSKHLLTTTCVTELLSRGNQYTAALTYRELILSISGYICELDFGFRGFTPDFYQFPNDKTILDFLDAAYEATGLDRNGYPEISGPLVSPVLELAELASPEDWPTPIRQTIACEKEMQLSFNCGYKDIVEALTIDEIEALTKLLKKVRISTKVKELNARNL